MDGGVHGVGLVMKGAWVGKKKEIREKFIKAMARIFFVFFWELSFSRGVPLGVQALVLLGEFFFSSANSRTRACYK